MSNDVVERLARIETKLDARIEASKDQEDRLRWIERESWLHRGGALAVSFVMFKLGVFHGFG